MAIELTCPSCASRLRVSDDASGRQIRCGRCMTVISVPAPEPPAAPEPPPATAIPVEPPLFEHGGPYVEDDRRPPRDDERDQRPARDARDRYDEPERPRRRRRPLPPPPSGRGPLFWVAAIIGLIVLGTCACCGGGYFLLPGENWQRHESPAGGFAVEAPGRVQADMPIPGMKADPNVKVEGTILWKRGEFYAVAYTDLPPPRARGKTDEALLDEIVREMQSDPEIKRVVRNEPIKVSGFTAREVEYVYEDGGTYVGRVVVADRRLYILVGGGRFVGPGNANIRRFLDSFEVTDKALAGGDAFKQQQVAEAAKKDEERRVAAEEQARREDETWQQKEATFEANGAYTGPQVLEPNVLPGLVAHLSFDDADPTADRVSRQSAGTLRGKARVGPGVRGKGLTALRPGAGMDLDPLLPKLRFGPQQSFTVAGWYRLSTERGGRLVGTAFAADNPADTALKFYFRPNHDGAEADLRSTRQDDGSWGMWPVRPFEHQHAGTRPRIDSNWHHFALVREYSRNQELVTLYLDGKWYKPVVRRLHTDLTTLTRAFLGDAPDTEKPDPTRPSTKPALLGALDEFCVYDRALSGWEVRALSGRELHDPNRVRPASPSDLPGATFHLAFAETSSGVGSAVYETVSGKPVGAGSGSGRAILATRDATESPRNEGNLLVIKGADGRPPAPALALGDAARRFGAQLDEPFTLVTWVRVEPEQIGRCGLLRATGTNYFTIDVTASRVEVAFNDEPPPKGVAFGPLAEPKKMVHMVATEVPAGWYHLAVVRTADGTGKLFINGNEMAATEPGELRYPTNGFFDLGLGWRKSKDKGNVAVSVDEFATFNRVLTRDELFALAGRKLPKK